ncbi:methyltransferase domain-containing protein [bacterium]|nr:methyltransferase domain-containing protein [bacterium]
MIAGLFLLNSTVYGIDLCNESHLRVPSAFQNPEDLRRLKDALLELSNEDVGDVIREDLETSLIGIPFPEDSTPQEKEEIRRQRRTMVQHFPTVDGSRFGLEGEFRVVPINDLLRRTAHMAHIGLSDSYGETVIYLDMDLYNAFFDATSVSTKTVFELDIQAGGTSINHELRTIALYTQAIERGRFEGDFKGVRREIALGGVTSVADLREWMRNNPREAYELNEMIHNEANETEGCDIEPFYRDSRFIEGRIDEGSVEKLRAEFPLWQEGDAIPSEHTPSVAASTTLVDKAQMELSVVIPEHVALEAKVITIDWGGTLTPTDNSNIVPLDDFLMDSLLTIELLLLADDELTIHIVSGGKVQDNINKILELSPRFVLLRGERFRVHERVADKAQQVRDILSQTNMSEDCVVAIGNNETVDGSMALNDGHFVKVFPHTRSVDPTALDVLGHILDVKSHTRFNRTDSVSSTFNPDQIPVGQWENAGALVSVPIDDWNMRSPDEIFDDGYYAEQAAFRQDLSTRLPHGEAVVAILAQIDQARELQKGIGNGICYKWSCATAYVLKGLPYIEDVKVMRTKDDAQTWLAVKFEGDGWYAFDRINGHFVKYRENKFGVYLPLAEAQAVAGYFSARDSIELIFSDEEQLLDRVTAYVPDREFLRGIRESASFAQAAPLDNSQREKTIKRTKVQQDKMEMSHKAAEYFVGRLAEQLEAGEKLLVVFPTGRTPEYFYDLLPEYIDRLIGREIWEGLVRDGTIQFCNLDEYVFPVPEGVSETLRHPETLGEFCNNLEAIFGSQLGSVVKELSYGYYMQQTYRKLGIPESAVYFINALHENPRQAAEDYEDIFRKAREEGRKIIRVYGIGPAEEGEGNQDVHLAFLKRGTPFTQRVTHYTELTEPAKAQNREVFEQTVGGAGVIDVPTHAISTGYPDEDDIIIVLASGESKALSLYLIMSNEPTPEVPATYIHRCDDLMVFVDEAAFSMVRDIQQTVSRQARASREKVIPMLAQVEPFASAYRAVEAKNYQDAYDHLMAGLLDERYVVSIDTAIIVLMELIVKYDSKNEEIKKILLIITKHRHTTNQTQMKQELRQVIIEGKEESTIYTKFAEDKDGRMVDVTIFQENKVIGILSIWISVPEAFDIFPQMQVDKAVFSNLSIGGIEQALHTLADAGDISKVIRRTDTHQREIVGGLFPSDKDSIPISPTSLRIQHFQTHSGTPLLRLVADYKTISEGRSVYAIFLYGYDIYNQLRAEYPPRIFDGDIGVPEWLAQINPEAGLTSSQLVQDAPTDRVEWEQTLEEIITDIRDTGKETIIERQDEEFRLFRIGAPEDNVAILIRMNPFPLGGYIEGEWFLLENFEDQFRDQVEKPVKTLTVRSIDSKYRLERLKRFVNTTQNRCLIAQQTLWGSLEPFSLERWPQIIEATEAPGLFTIGKTLSRQQEYMIIPYLEQVLNSLTSEERSRLRILDVGFGRAYLIREIHRRWPDIPLENIEGVEPNQELYETAREEGLNVHLADATDLPFEDGRFDIVLSASVIGYRIMTAEQGHDALKEVRRVLGGSIFPDGGLAILTATEAITHDPKEPTVHPVERFRRLKLSAEALSFAGEMGRDFAVLRPITINALKPTFDKTSVAYSPADKIVSGTTTFSKSEIVPALFDMGARFFGKERRNLKNVVDEFCNSRIAKLNPMKEVAIVVVNMPDDEEEILRKHFRNNEFGDRVFILNLYNLEERTPVYNYFMGLIDREDYLRDAIFGEGLRLQDKRLDELRRHLDQA